jgi:hypothetical protein
MALFYQTINQHLNFQGQLIKISQSLLICKQLTTVEMFQLLKINLKTF